MRPDSSSVETLELPKAIRHYLRRLKVTGNLPALRRVAEAGPGEWAVGLISSGYGHRCLVGHAEDWDRGVPCRIGDERAFADIGDLCRHAAMAHFDRIGAGLGATMAGRLCSQLARALLEGPGK
jgi:hypothetical protein